MLKILAHPNLSHQLVLVAVHSSKLAHVTKNVLQTIRQLKGVHIVQAILHMRVYDQLRQS